MTITKTLASSLTALLLSSSLLHTASNNCPGGKCLASFSQTNADSESKTTSKSTLQKNIALIANAYEQTMANEKIKPFKQISMVDDFSSIDIPQNQIVIEDEPLPLVVAYVDEIESTSEIPFNEEVEEEETLLEEYSETVMELPEEPVATDYICENDQEIMICDVELDECECI